MEKFLLEDSSDKELINIYNNIKQNGGDESEKIFLDRSLYSLTDDKNYLQDIVRNSIIGKELIKVTEEHSSMKLALFGAGTWGRAILRYFPEINWSYVIDNNHVGEKIYDFSIVSFEAIKNQEDVFVVVSILFKYKEVEKQLMDAGYKKQNYFLPGLLAEQKQYFDLPELTFGTNESFVDVGAYNGASTMEFIRRTGGKYNNIYLFEPGDYTYALCCEIAKHHHDVNVYKKAAWEDNTYLSFSDDAGAGSGITTDGNKKIETVKLDDILKGKEVTYLKMDIEGAEIPALKGARKIIIEQKPKLAISVYHRRKDIWEIPMLILNYNPDYKLFLRVYSYTGNDTVLYAI